jgi:16S rRNA (guanine527-N7)-methyltransferase
MANNLTLGLIQSRLAIVGVHDAYDPEALAAFVDLMARWNRKINLTALALDPIVPATVDRLIVEPVVASRHLSDPGVRIIDLGSGGGSPAIPFKVQVPAASLLMVESRSKKCAFLREATRVLGLSNARVEESRFEELPRNTALRHSADLITLRAVRMDPELIELIRYLIVPGGLVFRFVSETESQAPDGFGLDLIEVHPLVPSLLSNLQILRFS